MIHFKDFAALIDLTTGVRWNMVGEQAVEMCVHLAATYADLVCVVQHMT